MSSDFNWQKLSLKNAGVTLIDCDHQTPPAAETGFPYIAIPQIKNGHIQLDGVRMISPENYTKWTRKLKPQANDVIVVRRCSSGDSAVVPRGLECAIGQNLVVLRSDGKHVIPEFLRWLVSGPDWWEQVGKFINVGAVFDSLKCREIPHFELTIPPIDAQREIAVLLGALDDRITLLRETNATLEAIAQALFKSWFVDFDPVHAKAQGIAPEGMDEATAALFPDSFEESELGLVPNGWKVGTLAEHTSYLSRGVSPKYVEVGGIVVINQKCIRDFTVDLSKARQHDTSQRKVDGRELQKGDVLVNSTGVGTLGRVAQILNLAESAIVDSHVTVVRADGTITWNYLGLSMMRRQAEIEDLGEGSTGQTELSRGKLGALKLVIPSAVALQGFDAIVLPLRERFSANLQQSQTLATLRDTLLPRLISGQLRLPEAEATLEEALA